jgi:TetR/AcrR family transcriptional regulator
MARNGVDDDTLRTARRETVLRAARKVFEKNGLDGSSIRMIAKAAKCTTGAIYPYFTGKEEIYAEVLSRSLEDWRVHLVADIEAARTPEKRFEAALFSHFSWYADRPNDLSLALYLFNGLKPQGLTRELDMQLNNQLKSILALYNSLVREIAGCNERDAEIEVGTHFAMLFGLLTLYHTRRTRVFGIDARAILDHFIAQSLQRLRPTRRRSA